MSVCLKSLVSIALSLVIYIDLSNGQLPGPTISSIITQFGTVDISGSNNCEWEHSEPITDSTIFPFGEFAGVNGDFFRDAVSCGECYELECVSPVAAWGGCQCINNATVIVQVIDFGNNVQGEDVSFDLPASVASKILSGECSVDGSRYNINYKQVCCEHLDDISIYNYIITALKRIGYHLWLQRFVDMVLSQMRIFEKMEERIGLNVTEIQME